MQIKHKLIPRDVFTRLDSIHECKLSWKLALLCERQAFRKRVVVIEISLYILL